MAILSAVRILIQQLAGAEQHIAWGVRRESMSMHWRV
jgi:hypothetical protein